MAKAAEPAPPNIMATMVGSPFRVPDWRWRRALQIVEGTGPKTTARRDGASGCEWIQKARRFEAKYRTSPDSGALMTLAGNQPDIFWANQLYNLRQAPRWSIEARILARQTDQDIAMACGCSPDIIAAYAALFFDVRDRLAYRDYIANSVMGESVHKGLDGRAYDLLWKLFGYAAGPHVLDAMIGKLSANLWAASPEDVPTFFQDAALTLMKQKASIAALVVPVNSETQIYLIDAFVKYVEIERTTESAGQARDQIVNNIQELLMALPLDVGNTVGLKDPQMLEYDHQASELRGEELLAIGTGRALPHTDVLRKLGYPEVHTDEKPQSG